MEDYYECLHHRKEVRDHPKPWSKHATTTADWELPAGCQSFGPSGCLQEGRSAKAERESSERRANTESRLIRQGGRYQEAFGNELNRVDDNGGFIRTCEYKRSTIGPGFFVLLRLPRSIHLLGVTCCVYLAYDAASTGKCDWQGLRVSVSLGPYETRKADSEQSRLPWNRYFPVLHCVVSVGLGSLRIHFFDQSRASTSTCH